MKTPRKKKTSPKPDSTVQQSQSIPPEFIAAFVIGARERMSPAQVEWAVETLRPVLSRGTKGAIAAGEDTGGKTPRSKVVRAAIDLQVIETITKRMKTIDTPAGPVPMLKLERVWPRSMVARAVIDESLRPFLRRVKDPEAPTGKKRWVPRLPEEPLDEKIDPHRPAGRRVPGAARTTLAHPADREREWADAREAHERWLAVLKTDRLLRRLPALAARLDQQGVRITLTTLADALGISAKTLGRWLDAALRSVGASRSQPRKHS